MFTFTPLAGACSISAASQSLIELDGGIKILVDVGWDDEYDAKLLTEIENHTPTLSFVLLTHATLSHLGAFVHCQKFIPNFSQIPVYATLPVIAFGATLLKELYRARSNTDDERTKTLRDELAPTPEEIDRYFSFITPLKYSQPHQPKASFFSAPLDDLTITAYNSGHTLGGAIWHIQHEIESIVYAVDWNIVRENVIPAAAWFGGVGGSEVIEALRNPTALVCSSRGADQVANACGRKARDDLFLDHLRSTIVRGGSVLVPCVPLARLLELAWILEKACQDASDNSPLLKAKFYLASKSAHAMLRNARSMLDWMNDSITKQFEDDSTNGRAFEFKHVKILDRQAKLSKALHDEECKVILSSDPSLDWPSFSRPALSAIARASENLIVLVDEEVSGSAGARLLQLWKDRLDGIALEKVAGSELQLEQAYGGGQEVTFPERVRVPFDAAEPQSLQNLLARRQLENSLKTPGENLMTSADDPVEDDTSSSSDESDDEQQGRALNISSTIGGKKSKIALTDEELGVSILLRRKGTHDYDVRNRKGRNAVFPFTHSRKRGDEYGDYIRPEDFLRAAEKDAAQVAAGQSGSDSSQKRKWEVLKHEENETGVKRRRQSQQADDQRLVGNHSNSAAQVEESDTSDDEDDPQTQPTFAPSLAINARLALVDFSGVHDQRSLQMLIPLIGSKKLVLIGGREAETSRLVEDCRELLSAREDRETEATDPMVLAPLVHETIDVSVDADTWDVKVGRGLFQKLHFAPVQGRNIATFTGELKAEGHRTATELPERIKKPKLMKDQATAQSEKTHDTDTLVSTDPVLDVVSASLARSALSMDRPIYVGDVVLRELQKNMMEAGHKARFVGGGTLLIDDMVAVRKLGTGKIVVEGTHTSVISASTRNPLLDSFTQVKRRIYEGLPVVAAG